MRFAYILLSYLLSPILVGFLLWRGLENRAYLERFSERFGFFRSPLPANSIWVHAVSVGEVQAAVPLVNALLERYPALPVVVTTVTPTGSARVLDLFGERVSHCYAPYDLLGSVRRFFRTVQPRIAIIMETELWPNLYHECGRRNIPLVLASARISPRSVGKYRRFVGLFREALSHG
ncbi:MAG: glycosyltransferase N-terminal domain-containing protein, partial [Pseudomonadota bacterium]